MQGSHDRGIEYIITFLPKMTEYKDGYRHTSPALMSPPKKRKEFINVPRSGTNSAAGAQARG